MDQERDIRAYLMDSGVHGVRGVSAPMPNKDAINKFPEPLNPEEITKY